MDSAEQKVMASALTQVSISGLSRSQFPRLRAGRVDGELLHDVAPLVVAHALRQGRANLRSRHTLRRSEQGGNGGAMLQ
jgi:hypothetical protein